MKVTPDQQERAGRRAAATRHGAAALVVLTLVAAALPLRGSAAATPAVASLATADPRPSAAARLDLEKKALKLQRILKRRHLPYGTVYDPVFAAPNSRQIVGYLRAGDSAIWTGHHLAAESFRFAVTGSKQARRQVRNLVAALTRLVEVTGSGVLARAAAPVGSPWESAILGDGQPFYAGTVNGEPWTWSGNTSRDQYSGVFFGLGVAYELVPDARTREAVRVLVRTLLEKLLASKWTVQMPDGLYSTTFLQRPDQQLAFLQTGRLVDPERFQGTYESYRRDLGTLHGVPIGFELTDPYGSYFKFNLDAINLFQLVRHEQSEFFRRLYSITWDELYGVVGGHGNAHFNMIDALLNGPDADRDAATVQMLLDWLQRSRFDPWIDLEGVVPVCGDRTCDPVPVADRPSTDFLWQRSPFLVRGGGGGTTEGAGIDFMLPYWMARFAGVL